MELQKHLKQFANHTLSRLNLTPKLLISLYLSALDSKILIWNLKTNKHTDQLVWLELMSRIHGCGDERDSAKVAVSTEWETMGFGFGEYAHSNLCYSPKYIWKQLIGQAKGKNFFENQRLPHTALEHYHQVRQMPNIWHLTYQTQKKSPIRCFKC